MTKEDLITHIDTVHRILYVAKENFEYCSYLYEPITENERKYVAIDKNLQVIRFSMWQITIVELDKLDSTSFSQKYSLFKLLNKIQTISPQVRDAQQWIKLWHGTLESYGEEMSKICILRDKMYAYTDELTEAIKNISFRLKDFRFLINELITLINSISEHVGGQCTSSRNCIFTHPAFI